jgi:predicted Kef-type K+ transport protein
LLLMGALVSVRWALFSQVDDDLDPVAREGVAGAGTARLSRAEMPCFTEAQDRKTRVLSVSRRDAKRDGTELHMELTWIGVALVFGLIAKKLGQAALVGFLLAGFALEAAGASVSPALEQLANVGVMLLLFAIGLKLDLGSLIKPHIFGASLLHTALIVLLGGAAIALPMALGVGPFAGLTLPGVAMLALFASFSSTLFSIKLLEERGNMSALYGRLIIGYLVMQDLVAVGLLVASKGELPSPWALALVALLPLRSILCRVLEWCGHRELLILGGLSLTLGGAALFDVVGLKADLGPLVAGALVGGSRKAKELSEVLLGIKDLLLVGFFLTIGLTGLPTWESVGVAVALNVLLPIKAVLFIALMLAFGLRVRTAWLAGLALTPYSEFGLVVGAMAVKKGWLDAEWLVTLAVAMGMSFVPLATINQRAFDLYRAVRKRVVRYERETLIPPERPIRIEDATVLVFGMGQVGAAAYDAVRSRVGETVVGFDVDDQVVAEHIKAGRRVSEASATDADFWERLYIDKDRVKLVLLGMSSNEENRVAVEQLRLEGFRGKVASVARYEDEVLDLQQKGADVVFHMLQDTGPAFARAALASVEQQVPTDARGTE